MAVLAIESNANVMLKDGGHIERASGIDGEVVRQFGA
jgi:hypothetical protein